MFDQFHSESLAPVHAAVTGASLPTPPLAPTPASAPATGLSLAETVNALAMTMLINMQTSVMHGKAPAVAAAPPPGPSASEDSDLADTTLSIDGLEYKSIIEFFEELAVKQPKRRGLLTDLAQLLTQQGFLDVNEVYKQTTSFFTSPPYGMVPGNVNFIRRALEGEMERARVAFLQGK